ncbi:hypothetical protein KKH23_07110 [Patescibacteria group bacterium]|nr:hypothetical protein [Patescibacteria group bacterium]
MKKKQFIEPAWICFECAQRRGARIPEGHAYTVHVDICGICEKEKAVTEPRDFGITRKLLAVITNPDNLVLLPETLRKNGLNYTQIKRTRKKAMYETDAPSYEVFQVRIRPEMEAFGKEYPAAEIFPGNEDFGDFAWCYSKLENAETKYNSL